MRQLPTDTERPQCIDSFVHPPQAQPRSRQSRTTTARTQRSGRRPPCAAANRSPYLQVWSCIALTAGGRTVSRPTERASIAERGGLPVQPGSGQCRARCLAGRPKTTQAGVPSAPGTPAPRWPSSRTTVAGKPPRSTNRGTDPLNRGGGVARLAEGSTVVPDGARHRPRGLHWRMIPAAATLPWPAKTPAGPVARLSNRMGCS